VDKVALGQVFSELSVFPYQFHSTGAPLLVKLGKKLLIFITGVAQEALRLRCVRRICCGALHHAKKKWHTSVVTRSFMRSTLFWDFTQRRNVVSYRCFGTTYRPHLQGTFLSVLTYRSHLQRSLKMDPIGYPETSTRNYHTTLRKIPKERGCHLHREGSLKWRILMICNHHQILFGDQL
jgi:hypothetical protein